MGTFEGLCVFEVADEWCEVCGCVEWVSAYGFFFFIMMTYVVCGSFIRTMPQVMVISADGYFYSYSIDLENGGECSLLKQYRCVYYFHIPI